MLIGPISMKIHIGLYLCWNESTIADSYQPKQLKLQNKSSNILLYKI